MSRSRLARARRAVAAGVAAVAFVAFPFAKPAGAKIGTEYGAGIYFTRDSTWKVNLSGLTNASTNAAYHAIDSVYGVSDLNPNTDTGTCTTSDDACVYDNDYGDTGWYGTVDCVGGTVAGSHPNMTCSRHRVSVNLFCCSTYLGYDPYVAESYFNLCHELGHAVGLWHAGTISGTCLHTYGGDLTDHATDISGYERIELNGHYK